MKRLIILIGVVAGLSALLMYQATKSAASVVYLPSQLSKIEKDISRIRVAGKVADQPIQYQTDPSIKLEFYLRDTELNNTEQNDQSAIPVIYMGLKPDMFAVDRDVIIDGDFKNGVVHAATLLTQCPSKYEPPKPNESDYSESKY